MPGSEWSLEDAEQQLDTLIDAIEDGRPQVIVRQGRPVAVVLSLADYDRLAKGEQRRRPDFIQHILSAPKRPPEIGDHEALFPREPFNGRDLDLFEDDR